MSRAASLRFQLYGAKWPAALAETKQEKATTTNRKKNKNCAEKEMRTDGVRASCPWTLDSVEFSRFFKSIFPKLVQR